MLKWRLLSTSNCAVVKVLIALEKILTKQLKTHLQRRFSIKIICSLPYSQQTPLLIISLIRKCFAGTSSYLYSLITLVFYYALGGKLQGKRGFCWTVYIEQFSCKPVT